MIVTDHDNFPSDRYVMEGIAAQRGAELRMLATDINEGLDPGPGARRGGRGHGAGQPVPRGVPQRRPGRHGGHHRRSARRPAHSCCGTCATRSGAVPVELDDCDVDLAVGCTYKYLNAGPGAPAFAYVSARLREVLRQPIWGWFSQRDQFAMGPRYDPAPGMAKFMTGTPPILGTAAVEEGARLLLEAGMRARCGPRAWADRLSHRAGRRLAGPARLRIATPRQASRRGGHVSFCHPEAERIVEQLADSGHHHRLPHARAVPVRPVPAHHAVHRRLGRGGRRPRPHRGQGGRGP